MSDRIAILLAGNKMTGDTRVIFNLAEGLIARGFEIDLLLASSAQFVLSDLSKQVNVIDLQTPVTARTSSMIKLLFPLLHYLRRVQPKTLISNLCFANAIMTLSKFLTFPAPKLVLVEHLALSTDEHDGEPHSKLLPLLIRVLYPHADAVISVSQQIGAELRSKYNLTNVLAIANAVVNSRLTEQAQSDLDHPWFASDEIPVFLGAGRFAAQKDFTTLIRAFSILRQEMPARLVILGDGALRSQLEAQIQSLGLQADVELPGFVYNPYQYMSRATAFVLSSRWEALPTVLIEAMACGCQVIATQCRSGVDEILSGGEFGQIVPIADPVAMAAAMKNSIQHPISPRLLKFRADDFSIEQAVDRYLEVI
ncbi:MULTISPECIES: glycosyltransferase [Leptolyngbya]|uniref:glycosyltransferase n=1 Tax=Leptolyngbya TaxID=47251 RepID=UPI0016869558|nr:MULTISPECIES: glycosyltransferase [unclassified Leptolyngbya]MBD1855884.1 glycosyltransferase [Leptolyngbya sp. FACHB-1624]MBN8559674.1 glycosyltransferase [Leptolyngbya sp. UWPOB_LEPTO1]